MTQTETGNRRSALRSLATYCAMAAIVSTVSANVGQAALASDLPHRLIRSLSVQDGLPLDHLTDVAVGDGVVWASSHDGLVRYDGHAVDVFRRDRYPALPSNRFIDVASTADGGAWAVTEGGQLVHYDPSGDFFWLAESASNTTSLVVTGAGQLWATSAEGLLALQSDGSSPPVRASVGPRGVAFNSLVGWPDGTLIAASDADGLFRVTADNTAVAIARSRSYGRLLALGIGPDGRAWFGGEHLVTVTRDGVVAPVATDRINACGFAVRPRGHVTIRDPEGWFHWDDAELVEGVRGNSGSCLQARSQVDRWPWRLAGRHLFFQEKVVFTADQPIASMAIDGETIWLATVGQGLVSVRPNQFHTIRPPGWERGSVEVLHLDKQGALWLGSLTEGLWRLPAGSASDQGRQVELKNRPKADTRAAEVGVLGLVEDAAGRVLVGTDVGLCVIDSDQDGDACIKLSAKWAQDFDADNIAVPLLIDRQQRLWLGGLGPWLRGVRQLLVVDLKADEPVAKPVADADGPIRYATGATLGPTGAVYVVTAGEGLVRIGTDGALERLTTQDGLSSNHLRSVYLAADDRVWIGTEDAGLCLWDRQPQTITCVDRASGLHDDVVHAIIADNNGRFWLSGNRGLSWLRQDALSTREPIRGEPLAVAFDERDGLESREANGGMPQVAAQSASTGRIYVATQRGAVWFDPSSHPHIAPPAVALSGLEVDGQPVPSLSPDTGLVLEPSQGVIRIRWRAVTLDHADDIRFRYRLVEDGSDPKTSAPWSPPTRERFLAWQNLPAGRHTLEVAAGLGGSWSDKTLRLPIHRRASFFESTLFFVGLWILSLAAIVGLGFVWATRHRRARDALSRAVAERTAELRQANRELKAERELATRQATRLAAHSATRQRFVADLSHELRTPLTLVVGPLDDLMRAAGSRLSADERGSLEMMQRNVARLEVLADQFLDVARLDEGRLPLRLQRRPLGAFVASVTTRFEGEAARLGLVLEVSTETPDTVVFFDSDLIDKVLSNLLSNALKFTDVGGVNVSVSATAAAAVVSVKDTGIGLTSDEQTSVFERFHQADQGDNRRYSGVGIGLAMVRGLVELHGGSVEVESPEGQGCTFRFSLPRGVDHISLDDIAVSPVEVESVPPTPEASTTTQSDALSATAETCDDDSSPGQSRPRVLLVEDHPDMRSYLARHLRARFEVIDVDSGDAALAVLAEQQVDALVSDVMMPGIDGLELARRVRSAPKTERLPILLVSAKATEPARASGMEVANDYLSKPVRIPELLSRVTRLITPALDTIATTVDPPDPFRQRLDDIIAARVMQPGFAVKELASALAMSPRQFQRSVKQHTGEAPSVYLKRYRMTLAQRLLHDDPTSPVAAVAHAVGLSAPYFSRVYRAWFGYPPSEEREQTTAPER